jgi:hypothetical protein
MRKRSLRLCRVWQSKEPHTFRSRLIAVPKGELDSDSELADYLEYVKSKSAGWTSIVGVTCETLTLLKNHRPGSELRKIRAEIPARKCPGCLELKLMHHSGAFLVSSLFYSIGSGERRHGVPLSLCPISLWSTIVRSSSSLRA